MNCPDQAEFQKMVSEGLLDDYSLPSPLTRQTHMRCGSCSTVASCYSLKNCTRCGESNWCFGEIIYEDPEKIAKYLELLKLDFDKETIEKTAEILFKNGFKSSNKLGLLSFSELKKMGVSDEIAKVLSILE